MNLAGQTNATTANDIRVSEVDAQINRIGEITQDIDASGPVWKSFSPAHKETLMNANLAEYEFVDRYSATGTPYPDPETMCEGPCEGMGCYPHHAHSPDETEAERELWNAAHSFAWPFAHCFRIRVRRSGS